MLLLSISIVLTVEFVRDNLFQHFLVREPLNSGLANGYGEQASHEKCN